MLKYWNPFIEHKSCLNIFHSCSFLKLNTSKVYSLKLPEYRFADWPVSLINERFISELSIFDVTLLPFTQRLV